jgi:hypothetical protein
MENSMRNVFLAMLGIFVVFNPTWAQQAPAQKPSTPQQAPAAPPQDLSARVPPAKLADVKSVESILAAVYDVISGPPGERDWDRFRSLFAPQARLTSATKESASHPVRLLNVDDYINLAGDYFKTHGFFESAIVNHVERFGNIAQVFSSYESRNAANEKPFTRGINSIQLFYDGSRWWVLSILWDEESPTNPLPAAMATRASAPAAP